eukprot:CAMPEP_0180415716 /NCGR_PEP_ID=MMETSP1036_2-20121128/70_1 /TAXON_ID=632150 /ORGANISM="Azadinium spinosum, Strain 3D9" /LENGTH=603 /DNA_ID=CAMNT_0022420541 /DNA_START=70 /DNA_END=1882 /DNA_ORIENTATION=-
MVAMCGDSWAYCLVLATIGNVGLVAAASSGARDLLRSSRHMGRSTEQRVDGACDSAIPSFDTSLPYDFRGQNRNMVRNATVSSDSELTGSITLSEPNGLLFSMRIAINDAPHDVYHFVCTFSQDEPHTATCTLTYEEPARPQGPAWVKATFSGLRSTQEDEGAFRCVAERVSVIGSYPYSALTDSAGIYAFQATLRGRNPSGWDWRGNQAVYSPVLEGRGDGARILVVYVNDMYDQTKQLATAVAEGAESSGATVRCLEVADANYTGVGDGIVLGSGVYNGNVAPSLLDFINSFDFQDDLSSKVGGSFATAGAVAAGLESVLSSLNRGMRIFGIVTVGGKSWKSAEGTAAVTNGSAAFASGSEELALARDQGARIAELAASLRATTTPTPAPGAGSPPSWGENWSAAVSANLTQMGYDAGLVIVNFSGQCGADPSLQKMRTVYGDFDTVLTRCDLGREFIIAPPSRGGGCTSRSIGQDVDARICEACSCPFCVRDTNGTFAHGKLPSTTEWSKPVRKQIGGADVLLWSGVARSSGQGETFPLQTSIAYAAADATTPLFVNVSHPLWVQTAARIDNFSRSIPPGIFDIPQGCFKLGQGLFHNFV